MSIDLILGVVIGIVFGFCLSLLLKKGSDGSSKIKELEVEHETYRKQVDDHFVNTAVLFKGLTDQYRDVYRHIASGAGELCSEEAKALQVDLEETALLAKTNEEIEVVDELTPVVSKETSSNEESLEDGSKVAELDVPDGESINDDEVPLASEVEMSADIAEEIKSQADKKAS